MNYSQQDTAKSAALSITPDTKIAALLKTYPNLESALIKISPAFAKLQNPLLRKTVAKITSLRQAAQIGKVPLGTLINELRRAAGQEAVETAESASTDFSAAPAWFDPAKITVTLDARPIIESGGHPLNQVLDEISLLEPGQIFKLTTPFLPAPMLEIVKQKGFKIFAEEPDGNTVNTYITK